MYFTERVSLNVSKKISYILGLDEDKREIIAYGTYNVIHTLSGFTLLFLVAWLFNVLFEAFVIQIVIFILRKYSGGAHATSPGRCTMLGILIIIPISIAINIICFYLDIILLIIISVLFCLYVYYMTFKYAPVDTPTKTIKKLERRLKFKKKSLSFLHICTAITIALFIIYVNYESVIAKRTIVSIWAGLTWQAFTLSYFGHLIINGLDVLIKNTTKFVTGR